MKKMHRLNPKANTPTLCCCVSGPEEKARALERNTRGRGRTCKYRAEISLMYIGPKARTFRLQTCPFLANFLHDLYIHNSFLAFLECWLFIVSLGTSESNYLHKVMKNNWLLHILEYIMTRKLCHPLAEDGIVPR